MSPVSQAKSAYTSKKKALIRLLERTTPWLHDQNVGPDRLEEAKEGCKTAWDAFSVAHDNLVEILSDDEIQEADMEARGQEVGNLEDRLWVLLGKLTDAIALRGRD